MRQWTAYKIHEKEHFKLRIYTYGFLARIRAGAVVTLGDVNVRDGEWTIRSKVKYRSQTVITISKDSNSCFSILSGFANPVL